MVFVYLLPSKNSPAHRYIGYTNDIERRLAEHNAGKNPSPAPYSPWDAVASISFRDPDRARAFERYLKSGSGHAFASRHFW